MAKQIRRKRLPLLIMLIAPILFWNALQVSKAHFHTYWPESGTGFGKRGAPISWTYFWGHPYEMILFDAQIPACFAARPDGSRENLSMKQIRKIDAESRNERTAFTFSYTPMVLGDHYICLVPPPYFIEEEGLFLQDFVKQPLHVGAERGWERAVGLEVEILPLTRPYGWEEGSVFKGQAHHKGKPLPGARVEIEKFNGFPVSALDLPKDPLGKENTPLITRSVLTDCNGYLTCTLDEPGWWVLSVSLREGEKERNGKAFPVEMRGGIWIHIEPKFYQQ